MKTKHPSGVRQFYSSEQEHVRLEQCDFRQDGLLVAYRNRDGSTVRVLVPNYLYK